MDKLKELFEKMKSGWKKQDRKKKILMVVMLVGVIVFTSFYTYSVKKTKYSVLFSELSLEEAGKIVEDLETKNIKYNLEDNGTKILIDSKKIDKYRLELATEGNLPQNFSGMEIFDDMGMMVTDEDRKIMFQRGLEGELQRSIMSLESVKSAKVHLVMSEKSIFETEKKEASASVILDLVGGTSLPSESVQGIMALVSGAVDNLPEKNIKVIDSKGNILNQGMDDGGSNSIDVANKHQKVQGEFEGKLENNLKNVLEDILGKGKVRVVVNADLDFNAEEKTVVEYSNPVVRSEQFSASGDDIQTQDADGNIGYNPSNVIRDVSGDGAMFDRTINNELTTETTKTIKAPGRVNKLSASVIYDGNLSNERMEQIENIVATAIGFDFERDDLISVVGMEFDKEEQEKIQEELDEIKEAEESREKFNKYKTIGIYGFMGLLGLILLISIIRALKGAKKKDDETMEDIDITINEVFDGIEDINQKSKTDSEGVDILDVDMDKNEKKAKLYAKEHPDLAADLIKAWFKDE